MKRVNERPAGDRRRIRGTWNQNVIADNGNIGIRSSATMTNRVISDSIVGAVIDQFGQIMVDGNGSRGIQVTPSPPPGPGTPNDFDNPIFLFLYPGMGDSTFRVRASSAGKSEFNTVTCRYRSG